MACVGDCGSIVADASDIAHVAVDGADGVAFPTDSTAQESCDAPSSIPRIPP